MNLRYLLMCALAGLVPGQSTANDWRIVPGVRVGPVTSTTSETDLRRIFGDANVAIHVIEVGEGFGEPGTVVYGSDSNRTLQILWLDETKKRPKSIRICKDDGKACRWHTAQGASIGTDLKTLEKHNGKPFQVMGFGWDYSGTVPEWNGGKLDNPRGRLLVRLDPHVDNNSLPPEYFQVEGERDFSSANAAMQKLNPRIYEMILEFMYEAK